ncbi:MAG: PolC-type DNA polymerase III, partial [Defluviitaleaceae bacterium]|nr:PolC-type DNA polymerase III [Defluviitaleaceae bacterium]
YLPALAAKGGFLGEYMFERYGAALRLRFEEGAGRRENRSTEADGKRSQSDYGAKSTARDDLPWVEPARDTPPMDEPPWDEPSVDDAPWREAQAGPYSEEISRTPQEERAALAGRSADGQTSPLPPEVTGISRKHDESQPESGQNPGAVSESGSNTKPAAKTFSNPAAKSGKTSWNKKEPWNNNPDNNSKYKKSRLKFLEKPIPGEVKPLSEDFIDGEEILIEGEIFELAERETRSGRLLVTFDITDGTGSATVKCFCVKGDFAKQQVAAVGSRVMVKGKSQMDDFSKEICVMADQIGKADIAPKRMDNAAIKRVELHLHTNMSAMDGISAVDGYIARAAEWGHKAIAVTDHGVVQAFPEAMLAAKKRGVKVIYGVEGYLVDDLGGVARLPGSRTLDAETVVFDLETTGLHKETDKIIEIGAARVKDGRIVDTFSSFVNPGIPIPPDITKLTSITDADVDDAPTIEEILPKFLEYAGETVLTAHNASFDMGFIREAASRMSIEIKNSSLDTLELSRALLPELAKHKLDALAEHFGIDLTRHHRAVDDARATAEIYVKFQDMLREKGVSTLAEVNIFASRNVDKAKQKSYHVIILAKTQNGLKNLYELVSKAHLDYFYKKPRVPKSELIRLREGLIVGSACEAGELYRALLEKQPEESVREIAEFYDYLEIQPIGNNLHLTRDGMVTEEELRGFNRRIVTLGEILGKPVAATCDAHFLDPEDEIFRRIIMAGDGFKDADQQAPLYYRTTEEMLAEFEYLGEEKAREVVIENTNRIADVTDKILPIPDGTFPPKIDGAEDDIKRICMARAHEVYGDPLPKIVADRLEKELNSIVGHGFSVMYIIAQKLVTKSMEDGYVVGSRGSVGSSLAATMAGITEVNPLPPHYRCPACRYSDFDSETARSFAGGSGCDMPAKNCPVCGAPMIGDGHDIPFETFLGFDGDKEPDIDLNFSGEYQARAQAYTGVLFGEENVFRVGTIGALADKTAFGYVKKYFEERGVPARGAEINRLKHGLTGIRKTTGQHPGGIVILPKGRSIYEFCPVQRPANDTQSDIITTHFDYDAMHDRLLKLDLLGHDAPTIIKMLKDFTGIDPMEVPLADPDVLSLFRAPEKMGITPKDINCPTGSLGLPEFGTQFVRQMLVETQPKSFAELVRISGLSHGTDVWNNNAQELIKSGTATLSEVIPGRDDIMVYLIKQGVEKKTAFNIMEIVRKQKKTGKYLADAEIGIMEDAGVPEWYIDSCRKISYLFPKGHAVAYVMMTVRIAYFKLYHPNAFYAATFSVKAEDFDYELMCKGADAARRAVAEITARGKEATAKDKGTLTILEQALEMYARGLKFAKIDIYKAQADKFIITDDGIMPPLCSLQGLGISVAQNIASAREEGEFFTVEDFRERTKANKNVLELLRRNRMLDGIPETNQITLF